ncbi:hypothetical protein ACMT4L_11990 [Deinococcus sp. A31D244]|uniref:TubC N-terminal docking domain-related protein n=1 Tax=Deinococcus sp. A31D244 TaxID=3397675 RepID=UPI0039E116B7
MVTRELLRELEGRGVRLMVEGDRLVARGPAGAITPDLSEEIKRQKAVLLRELQRAGRPSIHSLPEPLARLVHAAAGDHLNRPGFLPAGIVPNLGAYVLASAALYAVGTDSDRHLLDLWAAHKAWAN